MFRLGAGVLSETPAAAVEAAATPAARAYGRARLLSSLPAATTAGQLALPRDRLTAIGLSPNELVARGATLELRALLDDVAEEAHAALAAARRELARLPPVVTPAFLPLALVEPYLRALKEVRGDPLRTAVDITPLRRIWQLWRGHRRGRL
jgi:phytoene synthase